MSIRKKGPRSQIRIHLAISIAMITWVLGIVSGCAQGQYATHSSETPAQQIPARIAVTSTPSADPAVDPTLALRLLSNLLTDNGGCEFNCLWGMVPGITTRNEVIAFVDRFGSNDSQGIHIDAFEDVFGGELVFYINDTQLTESFSVVFRYHLKNDLVNFLSITAGDFHSPGADEAKNLYSRYLLPDVAKKFGVPRNIFVRVYPPDPPAVGWELMTIVLYYPERGFLAEYVAPWTVNQDYYTSCFDNSYFRLKMFPPDDHQLFGVIAWDQFSPGITTYYLDRFKSPEDAFGLTPEEFIGKVANPISSGCVNSPVAIWK